MSKSIDELASLVQAMRKAQDAAVADPRSLELGVRAEVLQRQVDAALYRRLQPTLLDPQQSPLLEQVKRDGLPVDVAGGWVEDTLVIADPYGEVINALLQLQLKLRDARPVERRGAGGQGYVKRTIVIDDQEAQGTIIALDVAITGFTRARNAKIGEHLETRPRGPGDDRTSTEDQDRIPPQRCGIMPDDLPEL